MGVVAGASTQQQNCFGPQGSAGRSGSPESTGATSHESPHDAPKESPHGPGVVLEWLQHGLPDRQSAPGAAAVQQESLRSKRQHHPNGSACAAAARIAEKTTKRDIDFTQSEHRLAGRPGQADRISLRQAPGVRWIKPFVFDAAEMAKVTGRAAGVAADGTRATVAPAAASAPNRCSTRAACAPPPPA